MQLNEKRKGDWMQTFTGRQFWPLDPRPDDVSVYDIAHALGNLCRYNGQCMNFYSVAEHSLYVSQLVGKDLALHGLFHDAAEAYIGDIIQPIKPFLAEIKEIEEEIERVIFEHFGLDMNYDRDAVKKADNIVLATEKNQLMPDSPAPWHLPEKKANFRIACWDSWAASERFLNEYWRLMEGLVVIDYDIARSGRPLKRCVKCENLYRSRVDYICGKSANVDRSSDMGLTDYFKQYQRRLNEESGIVASRCPYYSEADLEPGLKRAV